MATATTTPPADTLPKEAATAAATAPAAVDSTAAATPAPTTTAAAAGEQPKSSDAAAGAASSSASAAATTTTAAAAAPSSANGHSSGDGDAADAANDDDDDDDNGDGGASSSTTTTTAAAAAGEAATFAPSFADPTNDFDVKHPLQNRWVMWYDSPGKRTSQATWSDHLKKLTTIATVEDFWGLYNNIVAASQLTLGSNYHLFKEGIEPKWEDSANRAGGKWVVPLSTKQRGEVLDRYWLWTALELIGEGFEDEHEVCGAVVSIRKPGDKIAVWTRTATADQPAQRIGRHLKRTLELPDNLTIGYQSHADSMSRGSSFNNRNRYEA